MTRFFLRLSALVAALFGLAVGGSVLVGRLSPARVPVFSWLTQDYALTVLLVDPRTQTRYHYTLPERLSFPLIDDRCRIHFRQPPYTLGLSYLNLFTGETGAVRAFAEDETGYGGWLPDQRHAWFISGILATFPDAWQFEIIDTQTGAIVPVDVAGLTVPQRMDWSPDSRYGMIFVPRDEAILPLLVDTTTGSVTPFADLPPLRYFWSPDSHYLAGTDARTRLLVLDLTTMRWQEAAFPQTGWHSGFHWTADQHLRFFEQMGRTATQQGYTWLPATSTFEIDAVSLTEAQLYRQFLDNPWSPDGSKLFYQADNGTMRVLDAATGAELASAPYDSVVFGDFTWSPDSRYVFGYAEGWTAMLAIDSVSGASHTLYPELPMFEYVRSEPVWLAAAEPGIFLPVNGKLARAQLTEAGIVFTLEATSPVTAVLPGSVTGAYCDPETVP